MKLHVMDELAGDYLEAVFEELDMGVIILFPNELDAAPGDTDKIFDALAYAAEEGCTTCEEFEEVLIGLRPDDNDPDVGITALDTDFSVIVERW